MVDALSIRLVLHGYGWGDLILTGCEGCSSYTIHDISNLGDPLGELVTAAVSLAIIGHARLVYLEQEPGRYRLEFGWQIHDRPRSEICEDKPARFRNRQLKIFDCTDPPVRQLGGVETWTFESSDPDSFPRAVLEMAEDVLTRYGADGFRQKWDPLFVSFPFRGVASLRAALATQDERVEW